MNKIFILWLFNYVRIENKPPLIAGNLGLISFQWLMLMFFPAHKKIMQIRREIAVYKSVEQFMWTTSREWFNLHRRKCSKMHTDCWSSAQHIVLHVRLVALDCIPPIVFHQNSPAFKYNKINVWCILHILLPSVFAYWHLHWRFNMQMQTDIYRASQNDRQQKDHQHDLLFIASSGFVSNDPIEHLIYNIWACFDMWKQ